MWCKTILTVFMLIHNRWIRCDGQVGPDPWDYVSDTNSMKHDDGDIPPDLSIPTKRVQINNIGTGEWFYKRILAIILKGGIIKVSFCHNYLIGTLMYLVSSKYAPSIATSISQHMMLSSLYLLLLNISRLRYWLTLDNIKMKFSWYTQKNEDGSIDISLQMRYSPERWNILEHYITSNTALSDDMFRRSMGYVEESIYKPTITEKIIFMAWTEYIQFYMVEYKLYIVWTTSILAVIGSTVWLMHHISLKHIIILIFVGFYVYEVFVSYKEAEKQELDRFITAMNTCKWLIWSSTCEVPPPDPLIFLKHMNPLKIGVRMFSVVLTEPMIAISETVKTITHGVTGGLWFPFDKIMYGILMITFNALIIFLLLMIVFNFILNIPFNLNLLGIVSIGLKQRKRSLPKAFLSSTSTDVHRKESTDRISGETLTRLLDVFSKALNTTQSANIGSVSNGPSQTSLPVTYKPKMSRSASTGRLPNFAGNGKRTE